MAETVARALATAAAKLIAREVPEPEANAEFILARVLKAGRAELRLFGERALSVKQASQFHHLIEQRSRRIPLAYVLGDQPFMGLDIEVTPEVLIPRPETEELVAEAIRLFEARRSEPLTFLEIGTGTGCVSLALAQAFPLAAVYATEISPAALRLAQKNAERHHLLNRIRFLREDLFKAGAAPKGWADLLISNPPYIPTGELAKLEPEVKREPILALDGGRDGLGALRAIAQAAPRYLKPGGFVALEIGSGQGAAVGALLSKSGFAEVAIKKDAQGHERIALGRLPKMVN